MMWEWLALGALALLALGLLVALLSLRARTSREVAAVHAEAAELRHRLDELERERPRPQPVLEPREYTITGLAPPDQTETEEPVRIERAVFADQLLRESVIRIGSLSHGVRRALSPESRNRIRFEMRREVRRARKHRRVEQREAYREWQSRQRESA
ncbi:MAG: hypothetical protein ACRDO4_05685 [Nocardioides sp.]